MKRNKKAHLRAFRSVARKFPNRFPVKMIIRFRGCSLRGINSVKLWAGLLPPLRETLGAGDCVSIMFFE